MDRLYVEAKLRELVLTRGAFKATELALNMPKNCLSNYASGKKTLPEKWIKPLSDYLENPNKKRLVLIEDKSNPERSGSYWLTEDGRKCSLVWEDEESMLNGVKVEKCDTIRIKIKTDQDAPEIFKPVFDFGDDKFLMLEKYTKYPLKDKPQNKFEAVTWLKEKADSDAKIKAAWASR